MHSQACVQISWDLSLFGIWPSSQFLIKDLRRSYLHCLSTVFHCLFLSSCLADDQDEGKRLSCHLQLPMSMLRFSSFSFNTHRYGKRLRSKQCHADGLVSLPLHFLFQMQQSHSQRSSILFCLYAVLRWKRLCEVGKRKRPWEGLAVLL